MNSNYLYSLLLCQVSYKVANECTSYLGGKLLDRAEVYFTIPRLKETQKYVVSSTASSSIKKPFFPNTVISTYFLPTQLTVQSTTQTVPTEFVNEVTYFLKVLFCTFICSLLI